MGKVSLQSLSNDVLNSKLRLPDFQRRFVWDDAKQKSMIASYLIGVPLGSMLVFEGRREDYSALRIGTIGERLPQTPINDDVIGYLLDGQQRVTTLMSVFSDWFDGKSPQEINLMLRQQNRHERTLFYKLHRRWFIDLKEDINWINLFGLADLYFVGDRFYSDPEAEFLENESIITSYSISNTNTQEPYHPISYNNNITNLVNFCIENSLIPLFKVMNPSCLGEILSGIQSRRIKEFTEQGITIKPDCSWKYDIEEHLREWVYNDNFLIELVGYEKHSRAFFSFSKVNYSGSPLQVFDLITARAASAYHADPDCLTCRLEDHIHTTLMQNQLANEFQTTFENIGFTKGNILTSRFKSYFAQLISIYKIYKCGERIKTEHTKTYGIVSHLRPNDIKDHQSIISKAIIRTALFFYRRLGVQDIAGAVPYNPMFLPIAYVHSIYHDLTQDQENLLEAWYWLTIFSFEYAKDSSTAAAKDCVELLELIKDYRLSLRFRGRLTQVNSYDIPNFNIPNLQMSGNPMDNQGSISLSIASFIFRLSSKNDTKMPHAGHFSPSKLLKSQSSANIFEHAMNASCLGSTYDEAISASIDLNNPSEICKAYKKRASQITKLIRMEISILNLI